MFASILKSMVPKTKNHYIKTIAPQDWAVGKTSKCAMIASFVGSKYQGLQIQGEGGRDLDYDTVESHLWKAFYYSGLASRGRSTREDLVATELPKHDFIGCQYSRCSRTDKGVSAARFCFGISFKMPEFDMVEELNKHLPDNIRIHGYRRVSRSFNARKFAGSRTYQYLLPKYALKPSTKNSAKYEEFLKKAEEEGRTEWLADPQAFVRTQEMVDSWTTPSEEEKTRFLETLRQFVGVHPFHNYTRDWPYAKSQASRVIKSWDILDEVEIEGTPFYLLQVHGNSFIMHHIRKMIGTAVCIQKGIIPPQIIEASWERIKLNTPTAPGLHLFLNDIDYDAFNSRFKDGREILDFSEFEPSIEAFKHDHILVDIAQQENAEKAFAKCIAEDGEGAVGDVYFEKTFEGIKIKEENKRLMVENRVKLVINAQELIEGQEDDVCSE